MTVWYPDDLYRRPVQVSFILYRPEQDRLVPVHETQLVDHLGHLHHYLEPVMVHGTTTVELDGSVSLTYQGRELIGTEGSVEDLAYLGGPGKVRDDGSPGTDYYGPDHRFQFERRGDTYEFRYWIGRLLDRTATLPAKETNNEWSLMRLRVHRLQAALGDTAEAEFLQRVASKPDGPNGVYKYTLTAPLEQVLTDPVPERYEL